MMRSLSGLSGVSPAFLSPLGDMTSVPAADTDATDVMPTRNAGSGGSADDAETAAASAQFSGGPVDLSLLRVESELDALSRMSSLWGDVRPLAMWPTVTAAPGYWDLAPACDACAVPDDCSDTTDRVAAAAPRAACTSRSNLLRLCNGSTLDDAVAALVSAAADTHRRAETARPVAPPAFDAHTCAVGRLADWTRVSDLCKRYVARGGCAADLSMRTGISSDARTLQSALAALRLVCSLCVYNPAHRATAADVLLHPFLSWLRDHDGSGTQGDALAATSAGAASLHHAAPSAIRSAQSPLVDVKREQASGTSTSGHKRPRSETRTSDAASATDAAASAACIAACQHGKQTSSLTLLAACDSATLRRLSFGMADVDAGGRVDAAAAALRRCVAWAVLLQRAEDALGSRFQQKRFLEELQGGGPAVSSVGADDGGGNRSSSRCQLSGGGSSGLFGRAGGGGRSMWAADDDDDDNGPQRASYGGLRLDDCAADIAAHATSGHAFLRMFAAAADACARPASLGDDADAEGGSSSAAVSGHKRSRLDFDAACLQDAAAGGGASDPTTSGDRRSSGIRRKLTDTPSAAASATSAIGGMSAPASAPHADAATAAFLLDSVPRTAQPARQEVPTHASTGLPLRSMPRMLASMLDESS